MERARRLRKGSEFDTAYSEGTVIGGPFLVLRARQNGLEVSRWGFAVGKRIAPKATQRNRTKRVVREAAREIPIPAGWDVVVVARAPGLGIGREAAEREIRRGLARAGVEVSAE